MRKFLAAALLFTMFAGPAFAAAKHPREHKQHYNYRYHTPKYKVPKHHANHTHNPQTHQAK
ncbi:MAG: hypothetical protein WBC92_02715 [Terracidiphilus sp.]